MAEKTIPNIPERGFQSKFQASRIATAFLSYIEEEESVQIQRDPLEKRVPPYSLDGG